MKTISFNRNLTNRVSMISTNDSIKIFCETQLFKVMNYFGFRRNYCIGGSAAGLFYGIDFGRICHDIDIIVPKGSLVNFKEKLANDPFVRDCTPESSSDSKEKTVHYAFRISGCPFLIDIIESVVDEMEAYQIIHNGVSFYVASPKMLFEAKKHYTRKKDIDDIKILAEFISTMY